MEISKIGVNHVQLNSAKVKSTPKLNCSDCDSVSFSGKVKNKNKSGKIPFKLFTKYQEELHNSMLHTYIRKYLSLKNEGKSEDEIVAAFTGKENLTEEQKLETLQALKKIQMQIDKIDSSFEELVPTLKKAKYYGGIYSSNGDKRIDVIKNAKAGDVIQPDDGYTSLHVDGLVAELEDARSIDDHYSPDTSVVMQVVLPRGVHISRDLKNKPDLFETEILLPRGARYKVLENKVQLDKNYIKLEYIDSATDRGE